MRLGTDYWSIRKRHLMLGVSCPTCPESRLEALRVQTETDNQDCYQGRCPKCGGEVTITVSAPPRRRYE